MALGRQGPVVALPVAGPTGPVATSLGEAVVEGEVVSDAVLPALPLLHVGHPVVREPFVDVLETEDEAAEESPGSLGRPL